MTVNELIEYWEGKQELNLATEEYIELDLSLYKEVINKQLLLRHDGRV